MKNKKADEKYYILTSMIIGILILGLAFFFIYKEFFTSEEINWETCKQSIQMRAAIPNNLLDAAKNSFSLKCKTTPFVISPKDASDASKQIADITAQCFQLFGEGRAELFPRNMIERDLNCIICARISMDSKLKAKFSLPENKISVASYINSTQYKNSQTYAQYFFSPASKAKIIDGFLSMSSFRNYLPVAESWNVNQDLYITIHYLTGSRFAQTNAPMDAASAPSVDILSNTINSCGKFYSIPA